MNIIIVSKRLASPKKLVLSDRGTAARLGGAAFALAALLMAIGYFARGVDGPAAAEIARLRSQLDSQQAELTQAREDAQREVNAIAARVGELQAQANRLNALGERLTRSGQLSQGEFDFQRQPGQGGAETVEDMPAGELLASLDRLETEFADSGRQLSVLEALLFDQAMERSQLPSGMPARGYITSSFGTRADPFSGGWAHHRGIDFDANYGDPVFAAGDGIVIFAGVKSGYGNVIEVDHGNGYRSLYAHNSAFVARVGDVVRAGQQIARAGSTGRSTGPHVHFEIHVNGQPVDPRRYLAALRAPRAAAAP